MFGARVCGSETASIVLNRPSAVTLCAVPLKPTDNSLSLWCSCKNASTQCHLLQGMVRHSPSTSAVGEYMQGHVAPAALGNASQVHCWTNCSRRTSCFFPGWRMVGEGSLSLLSWGKPEEENIDIWGYSLGLVLRSYNVQSQPSLHNRGTLMSQKAESSGTIRPITSFTL